QKVQYLRRRASPHRRAQILRSIAFELPLWTERGIWIECSFQECILLTPRDGWRGRKVENFRQHIERKSQSIRFQLCYLPGKVVVSQACLVTMSRQHQAER